MGTIVNSITIIVGSLLGIILKNSIKEDYKNTIMTGVGLTVIIIGINGGIKSQNMVLVIVSIVLGSLIGEIIGIEEKLIKLGDKMSQYFGNSDSNFSQGFVTASLVYCVGAMSIIGALESGLLNSNETLYAKSVLDGVSAIILASTLGIGVIFAVIPVFIYQGSISVLSHYLKDILVDSLILEVSAIGGILIMAIGINLLGIKKMKVGNMLPAVFLPIIYQICLNLLRIIR